MNLQNGKFKTENLIILYSLLIVFLILTKIFKVNNQYLSSIFIVEFFIILCMAIKNSLRFNLLSIVFLCFFMITQLIAVFFSPYEKSINQVILYSMGACCYFIFLMDIKIDSVLINKFFKFLILIGILTCIVNIYIYINEFLRFSLTTYSRVNFSSFYENKNTFGALLWPILCMNIYLCIKEKKIVYYISMIFIFLNLIFTFSRASILAIFVFCVSFLIVYFVKRKKILILILTGIALCVFQLLKKKSLVSFFSLYIFRDGSLSGRDYIWDFGMEMIREKNFMGYGIGSLGNLVHQLFGHNGEGLVTFHNAYIECLIGGGVILLTLYVILHVYIVKIDYNIWKYDKLFGSICFSFLSAHLIYNYFESSFLFGNSEEVIIRTMILVSVPIMYWNNLKKVIKV